MGRRAAILSVPHHRAVGTTIPPIEPPADTGKDYFGNRYFGTRYFGGRFFSFALTPPDGKEFRVFE